jgi:hypothetical protein
MKSKLKLLCLLAATLFATSFLIADAPAADPTGTWTFSGPSRNGHKGRKVTLTLALANGQLTGSVSGRNGETAIGDASFTGGVVSFTVTREFQDQTFVMTYSGQLAGNTIKGTVQMPDRDGDGTVTRDWIATRGAAQSGPPEAQPPPDDVPPPPPLRTDG